MEGIFYNANEALEYMWDYIRWHGVDFDGTKAVFNASMVIHNPLSNKITAPWRKWKEDYCEREWDWYVSGEKSIEKIKDHASMWEKIANEDGEVNSNYGAFWQQNDQLEHVIELLRANKNTRRAVISHYNIADIKNYNKDTPCNLVLNFYIHADLLNMTIFARSIDLVYGFSNDQYMFSKLQELVSERLGIKVGTSHYFITNIHLYQKHWDMKMKNKR